MAGGLIFSLSLSAGFFTKLPEWCPLVFLGEISFSIYMVHAFVLFLLLDLSPFSQSHLGFWSGAAGFVAAYLCVIGISYLTYRLVERKAHHALLGVESKILGKTKT
jgi:peptidoglycan/LPS O-acetylase OafA/YrhL